MFHVNFCMCLLILFCFIFICFNFILIKLEPADCQANEFRCGDGTCINSELKCNRKYDCHDGSDELSCGRFDCCFLYGICLVKSLDFLKKN